MFATLNATTAKKNLKCGMWQMGLPFATFVANEEMLLDRAFLNCNFF